MKAGVVFLKQLGDLVLLQPTLSALSRVSGHNISLLCKPGLAPLMELMPGVDRKYSGSVKTDRLYCFENGSKAAWLAWRWRARAKTLLLSKKEEQRWFHPLVFGEIHQDSPNDCYRAQYYWRNVTALRDMAFEFPRLEVPPENWSDGLAVPSRPWLLVHPTSAWKKKCWPVERWVDCLNSIHERTACTLVLSGGVTEWERGHCQEIVGRVRAPIVDLSGRTSLKQLLWLVEKSKAVVTVDGAVAHLAAAWNRTYLALFGPTNPLHWFRPDASGRLIQASAYLQQKRPPMEAIPTPPVLEEINGLLKSF
ncbi:MAG: glycosyltransferase family 9 protein [Candidatus Methylacidiphilales bacterium]|nr:glycosyltransferase family 9 protein [Candidatus Methylacidiphilales bacterium]